MKRYLQPIGFLVLSGCILLGIALTTPTRQIPNESPEIILATPSPATPIPVTPTPVPPIPQVYEGDIELIDFPLASWTDFSAVSVQAFQTQSDVLVGFGFQDKSPFHTYRDEKQNLQLVLYFDANTGTGCGFRYLWQGGDKMLNTPTVHGFGFSSVEYATEWDVWGGSAPYSVMSVEGTDASEYVEGYQESFTHDNNGKPTQFLSTGIIPDFQPERTTILNIAFTYREDGTLSSKSYGHNSFLFGSTYTDSKLHYDEAERLRYADCYITHGRLEYYYTYKGTGTQPAYCLILDQSHGSYVPTMICESATDSPPSLDPSFEPRTYEVKASLHDGDGMPQYRFVANGASSGTEEWTMGYVLGLNIYDENGAPLLSEDFSWVSEGQIIGYHVYNQMLDTMGLHVVDVNFDGYKDVIILNSFGGAHSNTWYDCWLWDTETEAFVFSSSFTDICNPALDAEKKCIYSTGGSGAAYWGGSIYKFIDGEFVATNILDTGWYGLQESAIRDGRMEVVRQVSWGNDDQMEAIITREQEYYRNSSLWQLDHPCWYWYGGHRADEWLN